MPSTPLPLSGVYGLFRFDGASIPVSEASALGLISSRPGDALIYGIDPIEPGSVSSRRFGGSQAVLLGYLDEPLAMAARLKMADETSPVMLAMAALARFGDDLPREMLGNWTLVHWDDAAKRLAIAKSLNQTHQQFVARRGDRMAIAPELAVLSRLEWIGDHVYEEGLFQALASARMAMPRRAPTMLRHVSVLKGGHVAQFDRCGDHVTATDPDLPTQPWRGSFEDASAAAETMLRDIVGEMSRRSARLGVALSGGLDSSLLAWLATATERRGRTVNLLTTAAPQAHDLVDDIPLASAVADHLRTPLIPSVVPLEVDPFRPSVLEMRASHRPTAGPVLFASRTLAEHAARHGSSHILYGVMGELTVTASTLVASPFRRIRRLAGIGRHWLLRPDLRERWPDAAFVPWLSPRLLRTIPRGWIDEHRLPPDNWPLRRAGERWGYPPMLTTFLANAVWDPIPGKVRTLTPFLDIRLLRLFAGMPVDFASHHGVRRAMARHMLAGRLPDEIRLQLKSPPLADYFPRLRAHAARASARLPLFRKAGIGEWLDLDKVERGLDMTHKFDRAHGETAFRTQVTIQVAEYLLWWRAGRPEENDRP